MLLSVVSGLAIGMGRIVTTFYVIGLGAGAGAIGAIGAAEALGKMVVTVPAGFLIYRLGARRVYSTATIGSMLITALTPFMKVWAGVALMRALVGATAGGMLAEAIGLKNMFIVWIPVLAFTVIGFAAIQRRWPIRVTSTAEGTS